MLVSLEIKHLVALALFEKLLSEIFVVIPKTVYNESVVRGKEKGR